ncbi:hypothetical protein TrLO_g10223 [Triparma laevis f. longispina]|uniref:Uncharacterized protein n=1 Tax=Triparma laevis f. longispina TaxID=1714387 RepID=A0A9W7C7V5_9STRA|nr:hypothetical protein TrLO_g10223 [Triparma laevis f. longispina]
MFSAKGYLVEEVEEPPDELLNPHLRDLVRRENESGATDMYLRDYKSTELDLSFKDGRRPSISVSNSIASVLNLLSPSTLAFPGNTITVLYNYPLSTHGPSVLEISFNSWCFNISSGDGGGVSVGEVVEGICGRYREIYEEEGEEGGEGEKGGGGKINRFQRSNIVAFTSSFANVVRRSRTNGKYGIWGHYIEELHITEIFSIGGGESEPTFLENS